MSLALIRFLMLLAGIALVLWVELFIIIIERIFLYCVFCIIQSLVISLTDTTMDVSVVDEDPDVVVVSLL